MTGSPALNSGYPAWICAGCGKEHGRIIPGHLSTFHEPDGTYGCGWCGRKDVPLTEPRDYGHPPVARIREGSHGQLERNDG